MRFDRNGRATTIHRIAPREIKMVEILFTEVIKFLSFPLPRLCHNSFFFLSLEGRGLR
jgi:hypothetical protein